MISFASFMRNKTNFQSEEEEKGLKSLYEYLQKSGRLTEMNSVWQAIGYLIHKDSESAKWFSGVIGDQVRRLEDQIKVLQEEIRALPKGSKRKEPKE